MNIEFFIVTQYPDSRQATVHGARGAPRSVWDGQYDNALSAHRRSNGLVGWKRRANAERRMQRLASNGGMRVVKIIELEVA